MEPSDTTSPTFTKASPHMMSVNSAARSTRWCTSTGGLASRRFPMAVGTRSRRIMTTPTTLSSVSGRTIMVEASTAAATSRLRRCAIHAASVGSTRMARWCMTATTTRARP